MKKMCCRLLVAECAITTKLIRGIKSSIKFKLLAIFCDRTDQFVSDLDLIGNPDDQFSFVPTTSVAVGFPLPWLHSYLPHY